MLKYILALFLLLSALIVTGQPKTTYFDKHWNACDETYAAYIRRAFPEKGKFRVEDSYISGRVYCTSYRTEIATNQVKNRDGTIVFYDEKGHKLREGAYSEGRRDGRWRFYDWQTHKLKREIEYQMDSIISDEDYVESSASTKPNASKNTKPTEMPKNNNAPVTYIEHMPSAGFVINEYLSENIIYPKAARKAGIEGRVIVKFVVDEDGAICDVRLLKGIGGGCDEEAVKVVSEMPFWNPGIQNGETVRVYFTLPITFRLTD